MNPAIICYDGSEGARSAIHEAARFLGPREVIVLHVREEPPATAYAELVPTLESAMIERAQSVVDEGVAFAVEAGLDASPLMVQGRRSWEWWSGATRAWSWSGPAGSRG